MKFKYPKTIKVGAKKFKIIYDKEYSAAKFAYPYEGDGGFVRFGMQNITGKGGKNGFLDLVIHEFKEILHIEQRTRTSVYHGEEDAVFEFHYDHNHHTDLCARLAKIVSKFIK